MQDKTKAKIEDMMPEDVRQCGCPNCYTQGADPWAEWCEKFEKELMLYINSNGDNGPAMLIRKYRQWLEGTESSNLAISANTEDTDAKA